MTAKFLLAATVALMPLAAHAAPADYAAAAISSTIPAQLDAEQRAGYRAVFQSIRDQRWQDAQLQLDAMKPGPLHAIARAEMLTAKGSPKADLDPLVRLLAEAPELPQAQQVATLAASRGAVGLPPLPEAHALNWINGAPTRARARAIKSDLVGAELALKMQAFIKADDGASAQALLESTPNLSPEALTEWQQKVAWMYFLSGDDNNARAMANKASQGSGDWAVQGDWVGALAAWRQHDCAAAGSGFDTVTSRASDIELRARGLYWASRADMACGRPDLVEARLKSAAQYRETFYGLLAREALGIKDAPHSATATFLAGDWQSLARRPNIRVAAALVEIGETGLAGEVIRQRAKVGGPSEYTSLVRISEALSQRGRCLWANAGSPGRRRRHRPQAGPRVRPLVAEQTWHQYRGRPELSRAAPRPVLHRRPAAQGDRRL